MAIIGEWFRRLGYLLRRRAMEEELEREMETHRAEMNDARAFGNTLRLREESRDAWGWNWLDDLVHDTRFALPTLRHSPAFTLTAIDSEPMRPSTRSRPHLRCLFCASRPSATTLQRVSIRGCIKPAQGSSRHSARSPWCSPSSVSTASSRMWCLAHARVRHPHRNRRPPARAGTAGAARGRSGHDHRHRTRPAVRAGGGPTASEISVWRAQRRAGRPDCRAIDAARRITARFVRPGAARHPGRSHGGAARGE